MFGNLVYGKFSLKETFWKFGVFGIFAVALVCKIFKSFLLQKLKGMTLGYYYLHVFKFLHMDSAMLLYTIGYFVFAAVLVMYSVMLIFGVWRSANEYDNSIWVRRIAKFMIFVVIYIGLKFGL